MLLRRAGLTASAGLSCVKLLLAFVINRSAAVRDIVIMLAVSG